MNVQRIATFSHGAAGGNPATGFTLHMRGLEPTAAGAPCPITAAFTTSPTEWKSETV